MVFFFGGLEGDRTLDLTDANRTLSQLSYEPVIPGYYNSGKKVCQEIDVPVDFAFFIDFLTKLCFNSSKSHPLEDTL